VTIAEAIVTKQGGQIVLFHAHWPGIPTDPAESTLEQEMGRLRSIGRDVEVDRRSTPREEETGQIIVDAARERGVDLIAMTTHGRGGVGRLLFGSVAEQVIRLADRPILLIPSTLPSTWLTDRDATVLLAVDQPASTTPVIEPVAAVAASLGARIVLVRVLAEYEGDARSTLAAQDQLADVAEGLRGFGVETHTLVRSGDPGSTILKVAQELNALAVGIGGRDAGKPRELALGRTAMEIVRGGHVPVLLT
jgi:nucleotide-binding universal stress UspA family protein